MHQEFADALYSFVFVFFSISVGVQEDAAGFVTRLIDKLLDQLKGTPHADTLKSTIFGETVDQFIGHPPKCRHSKERVEEFPTIPLTIRNNNSLLDSLKSFVQGEDMTGSNAYKCAACDAKVDTTKRTVFNRLPPTLIFNLNRFEMNYETMRSVKINDRFEFPIHLNMKPYTKTGIQQAEKEKQLTQHGAVSEKEKDYEMVSPPTLTTAPSDPSSISPSSAITNSAVVSASTSPDPPDSYYEYELTGVTVHTGTMDRGHYYSFINTERGNSDNPNGRWIEFNGNVHKQMI